VLWEPAMLVFVEQHLRFEGNLEIASPPFNEVYFGLGKSVRNGSGQTGCCGFVVSHHAIADRDFHSQHIAV